jgi:transglutaminase-like putative cysteine protease
MELRMHPLTDSFQQCLSLVIELSPTARLFRYEDHLGNVIHHFDIPEDHQSLCIDVDGEVEVQARPPLPDALEPAAWRVLDARVAAEDFAEMLGPGPLTTPTVACTEYARRIGCERRQDPLTVVRDVSRRLREEFHYAPATTHIDTPLDRVLESRQGVCQDFAHLMVVLVRSLGVPARYVSGYLHSGGGPETPQASHAWAEVWLPEVGWFGMDPTHDRLADECYIRTATGRDYSDVPPTNGVCKGGATSQLEVGVLVSPLPANGREVPVGRRSTSTPRPALMTQPVTLAGQ